MIEKDAMSDSDKIVNSANRSSECDGFPGYPGTLFPLAPMTIVVGHYGVGKTNLSLNLAYDAKKLGQDPTLADLDIVNPYFRTSDHCLGARTSWNRNCKTNVCRLNTGRP